MDALAIHVIGVLSASCRDRARATEDQHTPVIQDNTVQSTQHLIADGRIHDFANLARQTASVTKPSPSSTIVVPPSGTSPSLSWKVNSPLIREVYVHCAPKLGSAPGANIVAMP